MCVHEHLLGGKLCQAHEAELKRCLGFPATFATLCDYCYLMDPGGHRCPAKIKIFPLEGAVQP
jgi:hypothetical protein